MDALRAWAEGRVAELGSTCAPALELARLVAPAVRIETELLRALRLALLPRHGPWIEAALWFSPLVRSRSASGVVLDPAVAAVLRGELARRWNDPDLRRVMELARAVMREVHRDLSPALALEERVAWGVVTGDLEDVNDELARAVKALLTEERPGLHAWATQVVRRLPAESFETESGQALRRLAAQPARTASSPSADPADPLRELATVRIGVRRLGGVVQVGTLDPRARYAIRVPDTHPRLVDVVTSDGTVERVQRLAVASGAMRECDVGDGPVRVRNALREEFAVPAFGRWEGPDAEWTRLMVGGDEKSVFLRLESRRAVRWPVHWDFGGRSYPTWSAGEVEALSSAIPTRAMLAEGRERPAADVQLMFPSTDAVLPGVPWELIRTNPIDESSAFALSGRLIRTLDHTRADATTSDRPRAAIIASPSDARGASAVDHILVQAGWTVEGSTVDAFVRGSESRHESRQLVHVESRTAGRMQGGRPYIGVGSEGLTARDFEAVRWKPRIVVVNEGLPDVGAAAAWGSAVSAIGVGAVLINGLGVEAASASAFLGLFYRALLAGSTVAEAALLARRESRRREPASRAWAAFQLHGDPAVRLVDDVSSTEKFDRDAPLTGRATGEMARQLDRKAVSEPGLYRVADRLVSVDADVLQGDRPILVLVHAMGTNTQGAFPGLLDNERREAWSRVREHYGDRIVAFEHWGFSRSPLQNALDLALALPPSATVHLLTVSDGGILGELLCRAARRPGAPVDDDDMSLFDEPSDRDVLRRLGAVLERKRFSIERFVRVACPARGSVFPERAHKMFGKVSKAFGLLGSVVGRLPFDVLDTFANPENVPGLLAIAPGSPLIEMLNRSDVALDADLSVVAGTFRPGSLTAQLAAPLLKLFLDEENDLVVTTRSMFGGCPRTRPARYVAFQGKEVTHFAYFDRPDIVATVVERLLEPDVGVSSTLTSVFICSSSRDGEAMRRLYDILQTLLPREITLFAEVMRADEDWRSRTRREIDRAATGLALLSPAFLESKHVDEELGLLLDPKRPEPRIIPVLLEQCDWRRSPVARYEVFPPDQMPLARRDDGDAVYRDLASLILGVVERAAVRAPWVEMRSSSADAAR